MVLKNVFVTGGTGLIGRYVLKILKNRGYSIRVLSRQKHQNDSQVKYIQGDLNDQALLKKHLYDCQYLIHLAAQLGSSNYNDNFSTNVLGTKNILDSVNPKVIKKIVCVSTVSIFKDCGTTIRDETWAKNINSNDPYVKTKLAAYQICQKYKKKLPMVIVFPSIVIDKRRLTYSPKGFPGLIWKIFGAIPGGLLSKVGSQIRYTNYVSVKDVARGIVLAMEKAKNDEEYLLTGKNVTVNKYVKDMEKIFHKKSLPIHIPIFIIKILAKLPLRWPDIIYEISKHGMKSLYFSHKKAKNDLSYKTNNTNV